jgi:transposase InsO family protein
MDHTRATRLIDGYYEHLLAVRDLASHCQLGWSPVKSQGAEETIGQLRSIVDAYGPPLVIKSDNGSAFVSDLTLTFWRNHQVEALFSPAGYPGYNGALERSNSTLKSLTDHQAQDESHPWRWTGENVSCAHRLANSVSRPWGHEGPSPAACWENRQPITPEERREFAQRLEVERAQAAIDLGLVPGVELDHSVRARRDRLAMERTLIALGYLSKREVRRPRRLKSARRARPSPAQRTATGPTMLPAAPSDRLPPALISPSAVAAEKNPSLQLASAASGVRMRLLRACGRWRTSPRASASSLTSTQREPTTLSWPRRIINPLFNVLKAVKIMW